MPRIGRQLVLDLFSGPGYSPSGLGLIVAGLAPAATPIPAAALLPGARGSLGLDLLAPAAVVGATPLATLGVSRTFVPLPNLPQLVGAELFFQGLILSAGPQPDGTTDVVREVILP